MPGTHPQNLDPRPKRRKDKDNPYEILSVGIGTAFPHYYLSFIDSGGTRCCIEIDKPLFDAFDRFELEDISYMNEVDRHLYPVEPRENGATMCVYCGKHPGTDYDVISVHQRGGRR